MVVIFACDEDQERSLAALDSQKRRKEQAEEGLVKEEKALKGKGKCSEMMVIKRSTAAPAQTFPQVIVVGQRSADTHHK